MDDYCCGAGGQVSRLFESLLKKVGEVENPEEEIGRLNRAYEDGEPKAKQLIRDVSDLCLAGFRETHGAFGSLL